jgi:protein-S-isoprenylcysteine O-methyltransferase Ste14
MYLHTIYIPKHIALLFGLVALYGFLEIGTLALTRSKFRVAGRDATYYAVTIPAMLSLWLPVLTMFFRQEPFSKYFFLAGIILYVCGVVIRIRGVSELQGFFSNVVEKREGQVLISRGLHSVIRHPAYLGTLLISFSIPLALRAHWWLFLFPVLTVVGVFLRIHKEEEFLTKTLTGYGDYMKRTRKLIPGVF